MHEYSLHTHALRMRMHEHRQKGFFDIFNLPLIKTHPKHVPTLLKASSFHLNPSYNKPKHLQV